MRLPYTRLAPEAYAALSQLGHYIKTATSLEPVLLELVYLRASQLNGCSFCMGLHLSELRKHREPESRIEAVAHWRESNAFTPREAAALAWTEVVTNLQQSHAADADYAAVNQFFREKDLVDLTFAIAGINAWNRLSEAFKVEWNPPKSATGANQS
ncbi:MAG: carboxymuconolactone decarboxylase family protein [Acidobacteria bacterium]|nr:carboxymuconolactone decarboxylase family protein [Acidobacteriota bacterium]